MTTTNNSKKIRFIVKSIETTKKSFVNALQCFGFREMLRRINGIPKHFFFVLALYVVKEVTKESNAFWETAFFLILLFVAFVIKCRVLFFSTFFNVVVAKCCSNA